MSELTEQFSGSASSFGVLYPMHHFLALVPNEAAAVGAAQELMAAGFPEGDVVEFAPEVFVNLVEAHRENKGLWNHFLESLSRMAGTEAAYIDLDLALARGGAAALAVHAEDEASKEQALAILKRWNPLAMRYYAHLSIEVLVEHANTQTSAQQSGAD
jgi:hypothetical protein